LAAATSRAITSATRSFKAAASAAGVPRVLSFVRDSRLGKAAAAVVMVGDWS
jgi:hypothetical protein